MSLALGFFLAANGIGLMAYAVVIHSLILTGARQCAVRNQLGTVYHDHL